ncbi:MAG: SDR family oxidoreductase [Jatrophihabitans sp.]
MSAPSPTRTGRLQDKVAIVSGGAGGIGRGIVEVFIAEGAQVLFVDINEQAGHALAAELGGRARFLAADAGRPSVADQIVRAAIETFGAVHALINVAQASRQALLVDTTQAMFDLAFDSGFYSTVRLMQACHPHLAATRGSVVNFASGAGIEGQLTQASYAAAKEAVRGVSRVAANEWAADGIRVNVVCPVAETEGVRAWSQSDPVAYEALLRRIPMGRLGDPNEDIAPVVVFLASDDSSYMTGQTLVVDGGTTKVR